MAKDIASELPSEQLFWTDISHAIF